MHLLLVAMHLLLLLATRHSKGFCLRSAESCADHCVYKSAVLAPPGLHCILHVYISDSCRIPFGQVLGFF